jgi:predicted Zn-dependent protease
LRVPVENEEALLIDPSRRAKCIENENATQVLEGQLWMVASWKSGRKGRYADTLALLAEARGPSYERAFAWLQMGCEAAAEAELRAVLAETPHHRHAAWKLFKLLRHRGRTDEVLALSQELFAAGVRHSQLFYDWGRALALEGDLERAAALLFDPARVASFRLDAAGFSDLEAFDSALAANLLANPAAIDSFPEEEANRGSSRSTTSMRLAGSG